MLTYQKGNNYDMFMSAWIEYLLPFPTSYFKIKIKVSLSSDLSALFKKFKKRNFIFKIQIRYIKFITT